MKHSLYKKLFLLMLTIPNLFYAETLEKYPKLLIKIPTRSRPERFFKVLDHYYERLSGKVPYEFVITCDNNDSTMNNPIVIQKFKNYRNLFYYFGNSKSKIEAYNCDIDKHMDFDILLVASDDTEPMPNYDKTLAEAMMQHFPDYDGVINFDDGYQTRKDLNTFPVIGKKYYSRFGYIYHPAYKSLFCDDEFSIVSRLLKKEAYINQIIIKHCYGPYDALYAQNDKFWNHDQGVFNLRRSKNFDLSK